jgi:HAD superfamily hydrolase (TIGR01509 family)
MIKAVIFDLDGVIVNSEPIYKKTDMRILESLNITMPPEEYNTWMGTAGDEMFAMLKEQYGFSQTVEELLELQLNYMLDEFRSGTFGPFEGVVELVKALREETNVTLAVASSSPLVYIREILDRLGILDHFRLILSGESIPRTKPAPDIYIECTKRLSVDPMECIVIEDSKNGITAAKGAGMRCIAFYSSKGRNQESDLADRVFECMEDIKTYLLRTIRHA